MSKPVEVYQANTTPTPFSVVLPEPDDERGRVVLVLHRWQKPGIRVTFDRDQWREVVAALVTALDGGIHPAHYKPEGDTIPEKHLRGAWENGEGQLVLATGEDEVCRLSGDWKQVMRSALRGDVGQGS
jgi:hypothetical protein